MTATVFVELRFWLLVLFSLLVPLFIYGLLKKRTISRASVLAFGLLLVAIAGADVYLLQSLQSLARRSTSLIDDGIFASELSVALYVIPILFGGIGVNLVSHVLIAHLLKAEKQFDKEHPDG